MCVCGHGGPTLNLYGKTSDLCSAQFGDVEGDGYVPQNLGIDNYRDYIVIEICINCGRIQGDQWPLDPDDVVRSIQGM